MSTLESLSSKQSAFAEAIAIGATQADAYRLAYSPRPSTSVKSIHESASRIAALPKVRSRVAELQARVMVEATTAHIVSTDALLEEAQRAYEIALANNDPRGMICATRLKAQLTGLLVKERKNLSAPLDEVPEEQVRAELKRLRGEAALQ